MGRKAEIPALGTKFGRWELLGRGENRASGIYLRVRCTCGSGIEKEVQKGALTGGHSTSCGCSQIEITKLSNTKHGLKGTPIYEVWRGMRRRCEEVGNKDYPNYGGRGIKVCDRWQNVENFFKDMGQPPEGLTVERLDNSKNYEPGNCEWATPNKQSRNKRNNVHVSLLGVTLVFRDWVNITKQNEKTVAMRIKAGMSNEDSFLTPSCANKNPREAAEKYVKELQNAESLPKI